MPYAFPYRRTVTLTSKGQITLPVELRRSWNLRQGDQLDFVLTEDGSVHVRKSRAAYAMRCSAPRPATRSASPTPSSSSRWRRISPPMARR
jgi:AbrB family looped-hinge helix DNA binding protein